MSVEAPVAEEQKDHERGQARRHHTAHHDAVEGGFDKDGLIEDRLDGDPGWHQPGEIRSAALTPLMTSSVEDAPRLADQHEGAGDAVLADRVRLHLISVVHALLLKKIVFPSICLIREISERIENRRTVVRRDGVVLWPHLHRRRGRSRSAIGECWRHRSASGRAHAGPSDRDRP